MIDRGEWFNMRWADAHAGHRCGFNLFRATAVSEQHCKCGTELDHAAVRWASLLQGLRKHNRQVLLRWRS